MSITNDILTIMNYGEQYSNNSLAEELSNKFNCYTILDEEDLKRKISGSLNRIYRAGYLECTHRKNGNQKYLYKLKNPNVSEHFNTVFIANDSESIVGNDEFLNEFFKDERVLNFELEDFEEFCTKLKYIEECGFSNERTHEQDILWLKCLWLTGGRGKPLINVKFKDIKNDSIIITKKFSNEIRTRELFINKEFISEIKSFCTRWGIANNDFIFSSNNAHNKIKERYNLDEKTDFTTRGIRYGNEILLKDLGVTEPVIKWRYGNYVINEEMVKKSDKEEMELVIEYMMECWD